jgi:HAD superfamily hydrolase (TIGR01549 family)
MAVTAIVFDLGETLVDETRQWDAVADAVGVERPRLHAALAATIERGAHHRELFADLGVSPVGPPELEPRDLYPDVPHSLARLRESGYIVGVAANQPLGADDFLRRLFPFDLIGTSAMWGVEKPSPEFFRCVAEGVLAFPGDIAYVGDRVDNDVVPALEAGMVAVHLRRGPWGKRQKAPQEALVIDSLEELPAVFA